MNSAFDKIARVYDGLAFIVFGKSIRNVQVAYLDQISKKSKVLIVGGGTGWLLEHIDESCEIWYVETSSRMLDLAHARRTKHAIHFIHGNTQALLSLSADVVITNFFLDLFNGETLNEEITRITTLMQPDGRWLVSDFVDGGKWWQRRMLAVMYTFFRYASGLTSRKLPPWENALTVAGWKTKDEKYFYRGFMKSKVLTRQ